MYCRDGDTSQVSVFDVIGKFLGNVWESFFGEGSRNLLRIYKRDLTSMNKSREKAMLKNVAKMLDRILRLRRRKVKRDVYLPSFGIAGEIVNDLANTLINTATVWKYQ